MFNYISLNEKKIQKNIGNNFKHRLIDSFIKTIGIKVYHKNMKHAEYDMYDDIIRMPLKRMFIPVENYSEEQNYYSTLFHEIIHWTGFTSRLCRKGLYIFEDADDLVDEDDIYLHYIEEMTAEIGSHFLLQYFNIANKPTKSSLALINSQLTLIPEQMQKQAFNKAYNQAKRAFNFLLKLEKKRSMND